MKQFAENAKVAVLELNEKGQLKQNVRNAFKANLMKAFTDFMVENGFDAMAVAGGVAVRFANDEDGNVTVVFDGTVKGFEYDVDFENAEYLKEVSEKVAKAEKANADKAKKIAEQNALKEAKAKKA